MEGRISTNGEGDLRLGGGATANDDLIIADNGNATFAGSAITIKPSSGNSQLFFDSANSDWYITNVDGSNTLNFYDGSDDIIVLSASANTATGDFVDTSDVGLKENIKTLSTGLDIVNKMNPVSFDWKNKDKGSNSGFIAQEIEKLLPNDVSGIDYDKDVRSSGKGINVTGIVAHLVKAVQELSAEVEALKNA